MTDPSLADQYRQFAKAVGRDGTGLYQRICDGIAGDADLLSLAATAPPAQRRPNLLLAAVHYLLLSGADDGLADHYPTVAEWRQPSAATGPGSSGGPGGLAGRDPFGEFAGFCRRHHDEVAALLATRATQTNEVGRCAVLLPAFATVAAEAGEALAVVDLGASAGLNLLFDRYGYDYGDRGRAGVEGSAVVLDCEVRSGALPDLSSVPEVAWRAGLDRRPVDVDDEDAVRWLLACQWPQHLERFRRLWAAVRVARATADRGRVVAGDVVDDLAGMAGRAPAGAALCLYHSWVAAYLAEDRQRELVAAVARVAAGRPVWWVYAEQPYEVPGLPMPEPPEGRKVKGATAVVLVRFDRGRPVARRLADMHPHGRWVHWWGA
ncbi:MAG TPA: DUF2332 domain-containing protein [Acidimicrobiales bacterium]|nr:DUF2332 domain-containing protein [Acidimicrobiales bacterium]